MREDLLGADWVSLKIDAAQEDVWRRVDRPHGSLRLGAVLDGMLEFARDYTGELVTETMLARDVNDGADHVREVAEPPKEEAINRAYQILGERVDHVEYLIGYEGNAFAFTGNVEEDLLSITAVHPMREDAVRAFLSRAGADWPVVRSLIDQDQLVQTEYDGHRFYVRKLRASR